MSTVKQALLPDRGVVSVTGEDAEKLLSGLITNEMDGLAGGVALSAALLSPQGKILFDFLVVRAGTDFLLDVAQDKAADLVKRLTLYRLRAKVDIRDRCADFDTWVAWGPADIEEPWEAENLGDDDIDVLPFEFLRAVVIRDPRDWHLGKRWYLDKKVRSKLTQLADGAVSTPAAYHAHRIALGVPEGGRDFDFGDAFPHEANFDLLNGVSFDKGCYVGQEIVARMEHRGTVRKRIILITGATELPDTRPDVMMGEVVIGKLGSVAGSQGLAMIRLDRAIEAIDKGIPITAAGIALDADAGMIARQRKLMADKASPP